MCPATWWWVLNPYIDNHILQIHIRLFGDCSFEPIVTRSDVLVPRPNGVCRLKSRSLFVSHSGNLHSVVLTNAWAFATPLARGPCSPSIGNFSKDSRLAQIDRQRRAERNSDFRSTMAALGGSPVRFHLAKSRNCGLLPISPKRTEGLCLLAGAQSIRTIRRLCKQSNFVSLTRFCTRNRRERLAVRASVGQPHVVAKIA